MSVIKPERSALITVLERIEQADKNLRFLIDQDQSREKEIAYAYEGIRRMQAAEALRQVDLAQLNADHSGIRISALRNAGLTNVAQLLQLSFPQLVSINGIGENSAYRIRERAEEIRSDVEQSITVRFDPDNRLPQYSNLLRMLYIYQLSREDAARARKLFTQYYARNEKALEIAGKMRSLLFWPFSSQARKEECIRAYEFLRGNLAEGVWQESNELASAGEFRMREADVNRSWNAFLENAAPFYATLERIVGGGNADKRSLGSLAGPWLNPEKENRVHEARVKHQTLTGKMPVEQVRIQQTDAPKDELSLEMIESIRSFPFQAELMKSTLRDYQEFGAKYILHQKHTLLGDEMGLGKTIQAIAAMAHLKKQGKTHFLVVCPLSVLVNWVREVPRHSQLSAAEIYGNDRDEELERWIRNGDVGVTTYETIAKLDKGLIERIDMVVVDEAHYVKNPEAVRTNELLKLIDGKEYVLYMTGTPLENKVDEMQFLIECLRPDIAKKIENKRGKVGASAFRRMIGPVYLRRIREDVLSELPEKQEIEEWSNLTAPEEEAYIKELRSGTIMSIRRVSWNVPNIEDSSKAKRLLEICEQAKEDGRKCVIFSYYIETIQSVCKLLGDLAFGPITGDASPVRRQQLVDDFSHGPAGAVLVCQIVAGGVGLNIQAASVAILCEPQWKPSTENQAISRIYRMGQARNVMVHRLLSAKTIDEYMLDILRGKSQLFHDYAEDSAADELNKQSPESSMGEAIRKKELERYGITEAEDGRN